MKFVQALLVTFYVSGASSFLFAQSFQHSFGVSNSWPAPSRALAATVNGLVEDFDRLCQVDSTLEKLKKQLPLTLSKPLSAISANRVYSEDFRLVVVVAAAAGPPTSNDENKNREISICKSREELINLSDVIVLGTTAAQQATSIFTATSATTSASAPQVTCQLLVDDTLQRIRIPWTIPNLGSGTKLQGLSEFILDEETSKISLHRILNVTLNGNSMNGPAIGQALMTLQQAVFQFQQSPFLSFLGRDSTLFKDLRDTLLEQAATAASAVGVQEEEQVPPPVYMVESFQNNSTSAAFFDKETSPLTPPTFPHPGSSEWQEYVVAHKTVSSFCDEVIPILSGANRVTEETTRGLFVKNATFCSVDGSLLLKGNDKVAQFYQSMAVARKGTGGSWTLEKMQVNWKNRTVTVWYAANTVKPWTVKGKDVYYLESDSESPMIARIEQIEFSVVNQDGSIALDDRWFMRNLVGAVERGRFPGNNAKDIIMELFQQATPKPIPIPDLVAAASTRTKPTRRRLSASAAANVYYLMSDLQRQVGKLLNVTTETVLPPAIDYMTESVELRGYLDEVLLRGSTLYNRAFGTTITQLQQSIARGSIVVIKKVAPRVELTSAGNVRLYLTLNMRLSPLPGLPDATAVPLKLELVSDYLIDPDTGKVYQHRLVKSRVNGQLTPVDVLSRSIQRFLKSPESPADDEDNGDDILQSLSDALAWIRSIRK
jgi:hypothetical protein